MDFLDDPFADPLVVKVPTTGRFQPKAKPRPNKGPSVTVRPVAARELPVNSVPCDTVFNLSLQSNDAVEKNTDAPKSSSLTDCECSVIPPQDGNLFSEERKVSASAVVEHPEVAGLSTTASQTSTLDVSSIQTEEELLDFSNVSFANASILRTCNVQTSPDQSIDKTLQKSIVCDDGNFQMDVDQLDSEDFSCLETMDSMTEAAAAIEKRAIKFKPKPEVQKDRQRDPVEAVSHLSHAPKLPSENLHSLNDDSIYAGESDTVSGLLHMRLDEIFSLDTSIHQPDDLVFKDTDSLMPEDFPKQSEEKHGGRNSYDALGYSVKSVDEGSLSGVEGNANGCEQLDGINGEFDDNSYSYDRAPDKLASNSDENHDGDHLKETSQPKGPRKSKKVLAENNKPARKRKKEAQEVDVTTGRPPKPPEKFPRTTRRKRCVDKALLEAPEDELDLQRVPIRDLIILAEYKERQAKKAAAVLPPATESIDNVLPEDAPYDDNETFGFGQDGDTCENPSTSEVQKETGYYNYQSFMTKEPRARWTKQDTELFYQGLIQFGSDLSMIQQLFPGRTRHQIKLKYKKEERQDPMRLRDALTSRAQDHSHFELVIQRLQEQAARDAKIDYDDSVCPSGEDKGPVEVLNTQEDVANSKQNEDGQTIHQEPEKHKVKSFSKSCHSEEEEFDWNSYRSVF